MTKYHYAFVAFAVTSAIILGCGGGDGSSPPPPPPEETRLIFAPSPAPITLDNGTGVHNWVGLSANGLTTRIWGSITDAGLPDVPIEISTGKSIDKVSSRMFFTPDGYPSLVTNGDLSATISLTWLPDKLLARFYDNVGVYQGAANVTSTGSGLVVTKEPGANPSLSGSYALTLSGLDAGVLSFTLQSDELESRGCGDAGIPALSSRAVNADTRKEWLSELAGSALAGRLTPLQRALISQVGKDYASDGQSQVLQQMVQAAIPPTSQTFYMEAVTDWAAAFAALDQIMTQATTLNEGWATLTEAQRNQKFPISGDAFYGATYVASNEFAALREQGDPTSVSGVAFSRDFDIVTLKGTVDQQGQFKMQGSTPDKGEFIVTGQVNSSGAVNASWSWPFGGQDGDAEGEREEESTCNSQQQSGGKGGTIEVHNVGQSCGEVTFSYAHYSIPDAVSVYQGNSILFRTEGLVSGSRSMTLKLSPSQGRNIRVVVTAPRDGTRWDYFLGCPTTSQGKGLISRENPEGL